MPNPRLNEKNACPIAPIITDELILEKSGVKRNFNPSIAPGINNEFMQKIMRMRNKHGIMMFDMRSIPFCTPRITITKLRRRNMIVHMSGRQFPVLKVENCLWNSSAEEKFNAPVIDW